MAASSALELLVWRNEQALAAGQPHRARHQALLRPAEDQALLDGCATTASTQPSAARAATKRSPAPRSASTPSATRPANGTPRTSAPSSGTSTTRASPRRKHPRLSALQLDRAGRLALHPRGKHSRSSISTSPKSGRCMCAARRSFRSSRTSSRACPAKPQMVKCRLRSLGCSPCTGAIRSDADTIPEDHRRAAQLPLLGARQPRHRPRPGRLDGDQEAGGLLLMPRSPLSSRFPYRRLPRREREKDLLRFSTAGSVDDGKSTLIGRLLYDTQASTKIRSSRHRREGNYRKPGQIDFALLTDGLRAEREQGITIDVAYRYFSTRGASSSSPTRRATSSTRATWPPAPPPPTLAIILIDARKGVLPQSRRHAYIASLLRRAACSRRGQQDGPDRLRAGGR
jgi:hypothetical protein